jgi:hypothetical protein
MMTAATEKGYISAQLEGGMTVNQGFYSSLLTKVMSVLVFTGLFIF